MTTRAKYTYAFLCAVLSLFMVNSHANKLAPYILLNFNFHTEPSKNIQLLPKMISELQTRNFLFVYPNQLLENFRLPDGHYEEKSPLKNRQRFFRISLTSDPLETGYSGIDTPQKSCHILVEYREITMVLNTNGEHSPVHYKEIIPTEVWPGDFQDEYPGSCQDRTFLEKLAEGIYLFNNKILENEIRISSTKKYLNQ